MSKKPENEAPAVEIIQAPDQNLSIIEQLRSTTIKDVRDPKNLLVIAQSEIGLRQMIISKCYPLILFQGNDTAHVVFPPKPYVASNNYLMKISDVSYPWEKTAKYIFHAPKNLDLSIECVYSEVSLEVAKQLATRMIAIFTELKMHEHAATHQQNLELV